jgi:hypothetical protein
MEDLLLTMVDLGTISGAHKAVRSKSLTRRSCFRPVEGGADIDWAGKGDNNVQESWIAEEHPEGNSSRVISVRIRSTARSSDTGSTLDNGCNEIREDCVGRG